MGLTTIALPAIAIGHAQSAAVSFTRSDQKQYPLISVTSYFQTSSK